jgi:pilus assembly protein CpaF
MIDQLEAGLRRTVGEEIGSYLATAAADGRPIPNRLDQEQMALAILRRELDQRSRTAFRLGEQPLTTVEEDELLDRIVESQFSAMPELDRHLRRDDVTDVLINGCDDVRLVRVDGVTERAGPIARSDRELIEMVQTLARRGGHMEREFTEASPMLDLQLTDGSRLAAASWVSKRPYLAVRRHLLIDADQGDLVDRGMYDRGLASLFAALVKSRRNILIAGGQGVGKTTLMRAMLHECDVDERIIVLEQEPELHLDASPERHNHVLVFMERTANVEGAGAVHLSDLSKAIKRFTPQRIVVGEVRGPEVVDMLEAMTQGIEGSMCTMHANSSISVFQRLPVYARIGGRDWSTADVLQLAALGLDVVVFVARNRTGTRVVAEVRYVQHYDHGSNQVVTDKWFHPGPDGRAVRNPQSPIPVDVLDDLVDHGYDPSLHDMAFA